jgi:hypothetical protein
MIDVAEHDSVTKLLAVGVDEPLLQPISSKLGDLRVGVVKGDAQSGVKVLVGGDWKRNSSMLDVE